MSIERGAPLVPGDDGADPADRRGVTVSVVALRFDACVLDLDRFELRRDGVPVAVEPHARRILIELINHRDRVVAKTQLLDWVWGDRRPQYGMATTDMKHVT
jgi:DNA-binding winged helix-turn-helix (wHTH) protein